MKLIHYAIHYWLNIIRNDIDALNALLKLELSTEDYLPNVNEALKKIRKKAQMKGFRPGMVPIGLVKKMYGTGVMVEEIEKVVGKEIQDYLTKNEIQLLYSPILLPDKSIDFSIQEPANFTFDYEIGLKPKFELNYKDMVFTKYDIETSEDLIKEELDRLRKKFGKENEIEPPLEAEDILNIRLQELDETGLVKDEGVSNDTFIAIDLIKDEAIKSELLKLDINGQMSINLKQAFDRTEEELLKFLLDKKEAEAEGLGMDYWMTILSAKRIELAEMDVSFFKQVYNDPEVDTEEKFMERFKMDFKVLSDERSRGRLELDIYNYLLETTEFDLPEDFIEKYIKQNTKQNLPVDEFEEELNKVFKHTRWELISEKLSSENEIKVEQSDIEEQAIVDVRNTYRQYMNIELSYEDAKKYSAISLQDKKYIEEAYRKIANRKLFDVLTEQVNSELKTISFEEFSKLN